MLKQQGLKRTHIYNVRLAILLSLAMGMVNAEGFPGFSVLTTNVTGHAAIFAENIYIKACTTSRVIALSMLLSLAGTFTSSIVIDIIGKNQRYSNLPPLSLEFLILISIATIGNHYKKSTAANQLFAGSLLFTKVRQNALVSIISKKVVRTTHLTGAFTDLGIELAQLKFTKPGKKPDLRSRIGLKLSIISSFITGALLGAPAFRSFHYYSFVASAAI